MYYTICQDNKWINSFFRIPIIMGNFVVESSTISHYLHVRCYDTLDSSYTHPRGHKKMILTNQEEIGIQSN